MSGKVSEKYVYKRQYCKSLTLQNINIVIVYMSNSNLPNQKDYKNHNSYTEPYNANESSNTIQAYLLENKPPMKSQT